MNTRDAAVLSSRILALFFGTNAIVGIVHVASFSGSGAFIGSQFRASISSMVMGVIAILLWVAAEAIGTMAASGTSTGDGVSTRPLDHLKGTAVFILGLYFGARAIPEIVEWLADSDGGRSLRGVAGAVTQLVIGGLLMRMGQNTVQKTSPATSDG